MPSEASPSTAFYVRLDTPMFYEHADMKNFDAPFFEGFVADLRKVFQLHKFYKDGDVVNPKLTDFPVGYARHGAITMFNDRNSVFVYFSFPYAKRKFVKWAFNNICKQYAGIFVVKDIEGTHMITDMYFDKGEVHVHVVDV